MSSERLLAAQIYRNAITYDRNQIRFYVLLARQSPHLRAHMLSRAREYAKDIKAMLRDWKLST